MFESSPPRTALKESHLVDCTHASEIVCQYELALSTLTDALQAPSEKRVDLSGEGKGAMQHAVYTGHKSLTLPAITASRVTTLPLLQTSLSKRLPF